MSKKNNVNPDHYKIAGPDRPNETVPGREVNRAHLRDVSRIPKGAGKSSGKTESRPSQAAEEDQATRDSADGMQTSTKFGVVSGAEKQESSRHFIEPTPQSTPVAGAFGKTGSLSETEEEMVHPEEDAESDWNDFIAERRRQDRRAKK